MPVLRRRAAFAVCIMLSACAAAEPSGAAGSAAPLGYGAFLAARYADTQQDPSAAEKYYQFALRADPQNQDLANEAFAAALLSGSRDSVTLASLVPGNPLATMLLGNQAALDGDFGKAGQIFASLPLDDISGLIKPLLLAWAQTGGGDPAGAIALLTPGFDSTPFGPIYLLNAALIADESGDMKDAAAFYAQSSGDQAPSLRLAQILASWQARQGQMIAAQAELAQLIAAHPDLAIALPAMQAQINQKVINSANDGLAEAYLTLAGALNQPAQAGLRTILLRFALFLRPDLSAARLLLAGIQTATGGGDNSGNGQNTAPPVTPAQMSAALASLQPIPANDPLYGPAAMQEASLLASLNQPAAAVALLNRVAAFMPEDPDPVETAADVLRGNSQFAEAITAYDKAIALSGQPLPPADWPLFFDRGICEDQLGDWNAAQRDMLRALALSPNEPYVLNYLAYSWALKGEKLPQAAAMLQEAVGLDPNDGAVIDSLGFVKLRQGQTAQAVSLLTQAVELEPTDAEINSHLGDAFWAAGLKLQADYQWERALSLGPDEKLQAEITGKLKQADQHG